MIHLREIFLILKEQKVTISMIELHRIQWTWDDIELVKQEHLGIHSLKALANEKPSMLQFKPRKALAVFSDSYGLRLKIRPYELNNSLILWEGYYDTSKNI